MCKHCAYYYQDYGPDNRPIGHPCCHYDGPSGQAPCDVFDPVDRFD